MIETDKSHEEWLKFVNNPSAIEGIKFGQSVMRDEVKRMISLRLPIKERIFLEWILKVTAGEFYLMLSPGQSLHFGLLKRNLKACMVIGYCHPNEVHKHFYIGYDSVLELINLDSAKKGEGYKTVRRLSMIADKLKIPISLWTEKEINVPIFERYGFINKGRAGINNEFLMIRFPKGEIK